MRELEMERSIVRRPVGNICLTNAKRHAKQLGEEGCTLTLTSLLSSINSKRLQSCERSNAAGGKAIAQSNEICLAIICEASREREVEIDNEAEEAGQKRKEIACCATIAVQTRPCHHDRSSDEDRRNRRRKLVVVQ
jgi:hypothetical protein